MPWRHLLPRRPPPPFYLPHPPHRPPSPRLAELDGIPFRGKPLKIRRPNDYKAHMVQEGPLPPMNLAAVGITPGGRGGGAPGTISHQVDEGPNKLFIGGIPYVSV